MKTSGLPVTADPHVPAVWLPPAQAHPAQPQQTSELPQHLQPAWLGGAADSELPQPAALLLAAAVQAPLSQTQHDAVVRRLQPSPVMVLPLQVPQI